MTPTPETLERLSRTMLPIHRSDEKTAELCQAGRVRGSAHSCVAQEAGAAGAGARLGREDSIVGNRRGHRHCPAKGPRVDRIAAERMTCPWSSPRRSSRS